MSVVAAAARWRDQIGERRLWAVIRLLWILIALGSAIGTSYLCYREVLNVIHRPTNLGVSHLRWHLNWLRALGIILPLAVSTGLALLWVIRVARWRRLPVSPVRAWQRGGAVLSTLVLGLGSILPIFWGIVWATQPPVLGLIQLAHAAAILGGIAGVTLASWAWRWPTFRATNGVFFASLGIVASLIAMPSAASAVTLESSTFFPLTKDWSVQLLAHTDDTRLYNAIGCDGLDCVALGRGLDPALVSLRSTDGGNTWAPSPVLTQPNSLSSGIPLSVACWDSGTRCLATDNPSLISTMDGGTSWQIAASQPGPEVFAKWLSCAAGTDHCVVVGVSNTRTSQSAYGVTDAAISYTVNGGSSWAIGVLPPGHWRLGRASCPGAGTCFVPAEQESLVRSGSRTEVTAHPAVLRSDDGGMTWTVAPVPTGSPLLDEIQCPDITHCVAIGFVPDNPKAVLGSAGEIESLSTSDGGHTWSITPIIHTDSGGGRLACAPGSGCVAIASDGFGGDVMVWTSSDTGTTRQRAKGHIPPVDAFDITCPSSGRCLIVGTGVVRGVTGMRGVIFLGDAAGATWSLAHASQGA